MDATHWDGCWQEHHACAREEIHRLRRELAEARKPVDDALIADARPIDTAPKDGTEILGYREDAGWMLIRWTCPQDFLTERELGGLDAESAEAEDWFYADFVSGGRLDGSERPTHWMPLPAHPLAAGTQREGE